jgi:hypothetical protein
MNSTLLPALNKKSHGKTWANIQNNFGTNCGGG